MRLVSPADLGYPAKSHHALSRGPPSQLGTGPEGLKVSLPPPGGVLLPGALCPFQLVPYQQVRQGCQRKAKGSGLLPKLSPSCSLPTEHSPLPPFCLPLQKYPIVWQGLLALKNDTAAVQLHFVSGNNVLAHRSLPAPEGGPPLRIAQRMRLEASQLEGVARRMMVSGGAGGGARGSLMDMDTHTHTPPRF